MFYPAAFILHLMFLSVRHFLIQKEKVTYFASNLWNFISSDIEDFANISDFSTITEKWKPDDCPYSF